MIIINYNPAMQIPPICEKDIDNKIIISVLKDSNIFMATEQAESRFAWFGCSFRRSNLNPVLVAYVTNSLINLLIKDYSECYGHVVFYVLEDISDPEFISNKYNLRDANIRLLEMLKGRALECFSEVTQMKVISQDPATVIPDVNETTYVSKLVVAVLIIPENCIGPGTYIAYATRLAFGGDIAFTGQRIECNYQLSDWYGSTRTFIDLLINFWEIFRSFEPIVYILESYEDFNEVMTKYNVQNKYILEELTNICNLKFRR